MKKIMLDSGHDRGKYNQSPVVPQYWEGERMWRLCGFLSEALRERGFGVGCTKSRCDQAVEVTARGRMGKGYDALISLHTDACGDAAVNRPSGIYLVADGCGETDSRSRELAVLLSDTVARVMGTSPAEQYSRLSGRDRDGDGRVNDDYYGVLYGAHQVGVPAVILECSFHTNRASAAWLMEDGNLKTLAGALGDALAEFFEEDEEVKMETLRKGSEGPQVRVLQALLTGFGYDLGRCGVDGSFGGKTDEALRKYQSRNGLTPDGIAGKITWGHLLAQDG